MKVSKLWLDKFFDNALPNAEALAEALTFHAFEIDGIEKIGSDDVLDVKVTPNRGHDCLSHRGIAKELSAILKIPLTHDAFDTKADISKRTNVVSVSINSSLCKRYVAGYIKGVNVGPSPAWLRERLEAIGQRSINNVVDATNFVMFNTGQPLHAFDAHKLGSLDIGVRLAKSGEKMLALDGKEYTLSNSMLVITAGERAVGIAGVKGGMPAAIDESTTDIVIESANFDGVSVRRTAQALKLRTDASARFEQGLSPELAARGMQGMMEFIQHQTGGEIVGFVDAYPTPQEKTYVSVTLEKINNALGTTLTNADVSDVFTRLGLPYKEEQGVFEVQPPLERLDLVIAEDLVEEVGRIIGYDKVPVVQLPPFSGKVEINQNFAAAEAARAEFIAKGYSGVFTSVFAEVGERAVLNKVDSVKPFLRSNLTDGLTEALKKNIPNKDLLGLKEVKLFEIGTVWKGGKEVVMLGTVSEKSPATETPIEFADTGGVKGYDISYPLSTAERFAQFSKYPYIVRDIAMWTSPTNDEGQVQQTIQKEAGSLAVKVLLFDTFEKQGRVSLAYRIVFQSFDRTLTEVEANQIMEKISAALKAQDFEIR